ncbi:Abi family protein [Mycoplasma marinum]|uniref:Abi family protein n=1 Tax=Mycoplasma marinum TaxID=1937190 RepID=A0A4R0XID6_9MOLU|nr:Abi family protein [Mycoplasma marinum]TCG10346.1 hypothetical protein C4B24_04760 [Mycoplasma marinum]
MKKTFNTNKEMIAKLQKRGLIINDDSNVFVFNNYVNLIYIYSRPFYDVENQKYTKEINVKELIKINKIDIKIQSALFSRIMIIEGKIRTVLAAQIAREIKPHRAQTN